jgi:hypothetical protein
MVRIYHNLRSPIFLLLDNMVDTLLSETTEIQIVKYFPREYDAVWKWLASNKTFHIMRDHPAHCVFFPI